MASNNSSTVEHGVWSEEEHDKFLVALKVYPRGPWKKIAESIGTRSARQVQTHAQKYYEKVARRVRGLRKDRKRLVRPEHRLDEDMATLCKVAENEASVSRLGPIRNGLNAVRAIPREVFASGQRHVDAGGEYFNTGLEANQTQSRRDSIESLLEEEDDDDCGDTTAMNGTAESDGSDSLLGIDQTYLDYLITILDSCEGDSC
ncbi:Myb-like dna-binding protein, partial [Globisporangium splendens]